LLISRSKVLSDLPEPGVPSPSQSGDTPVILQLSQPSESFATTLYLDDATRDLYLRTDHTHSLQNRLTLYGMVLENYHQTGILYHTIGVNGATFSDFNDSELFMTQLQALQPDLIIISLGTNETVNRSFPVTGFFREVDQLVNALQEYSPHADILFTTPPDAFRAGKAPNEEIVKAEESLLNYSLSNDLACWDLYQIMGGAASVQSWYGAGLAQRDKLHFTRAGYELQGKLLFEALINGYGSFRSAK
jgi:lysophospholipase L1-like esterase